MGRQNRSRKRRDEMNKIKKVRYEAKELIRLKKTLGLIDSGGNEIMNVGEVATIKTSKELKAEKKSKEEKELEYEFEEQREKGSEVTLVNEKTGKTHTYNSKTMKDQYGTYPVWYKPKTMRRKRKKEHADKKRFRQAWTTVNIPL